MPARPRLLHRPALRPRRYTWVMALRHPLPPPEPEPPENGYDATVAESFPASDPPPGVIKLGPRPQPAPRRERKRA